MKRIGALALILAIALTVSGCEEETQGVDETGINLGFTNCLTFAIWLWIDDEYEGTFTSEETQFVEVAAGSHTLYARSNAFLDQENKYFCWSTSFSVSEGQLTYVTLDCTNAWCPEDGGGGGVVE